MMPPKGVNAANLRSAIVGLAFCGVKNAPLLSIFGQKKCSITVLYSV
jgi:hypothetical protein